MRGIALNPVQPPWRPVLEPTRAERAIEVAVEVAGRCRDRATIDRAVVAHTDFAQHKRMPRWQPDSTAYGNAGIALLCGYLDACFPDEGWDQAGREHLEVAARTLEDAGPVEVGLFGGLSGVAFTAWSLSRGGRRIEA